MSLQGETIFGSPGDIVCRKTIWTDVVKFFLFNYGLHAVTVVISPGSGNELTALNIFTALVCPLLGVIRALNAMRLIPSLWVDQIRLRRRGATVPGLFDDKLAMAHYAGALCMLVPWELKEHFEYIIFDSTGIYICLDFSDFEGSGLPTGFQGLVSIHGQIPFPRRTFYQRLGAMIGVPLNGSITLAPEDGSPGQRYGLVRVPSHFKVSPLLKEFPNERRTEISCDYSIIKPIVAIFQICYGSFELYEARGSQIDRFGYAAYSFTVIPYIMMSIMNLVALLCSPSYPYMYLVHYGDKPEQTNVEEEEMFVTRPVVEELQEGVEDSQVISEVAPMQDSEEGNLDTHNHECARELEVLISGAVGCAHITKGSLARKPPALSLTMWMIATILVIFLVVILLIPAATTYIIIYLLSNFDGRQSTTAQRVWIISSLVISNVLFIIFGLIHLLLHYRYTTTNRTAPAIVIAWRGWRAVLPFANTLIVQRNISYSLMAIPALGAFVVVAQMMMEHETCIRI